jgi:hypothetical protein
MSMEIWWHLIADGMISRGAIRKILVEKRGAKKTRSRPHVALSLTSRKQARPGREL